HDREAEAGAADAAGDEGVEQALAQFGGDAGAAVGDGELQAAVVDADGELDGRVGRAVLEGVAHEVDAYLLDAHRVEGPGRGGVSVVEGDARGVGEVDDAADEGADVGGGGGDRPGAHEVEQAGGELLEAARLVDDPARLGRAAGVAGELLLEQL